MGTRLKVIEDERTARKDQEHYDNVNILVNKMIKADLLDKDAAQTKFETLNKLDSDALNEVSTIVNKRLDDAKADDKPIGRETVPSTILKDDTNNNKEETKKAPANMSPIDIAYAKLKNKQGEPSPSGAGFF